MEEVLFRKRFLLEDKFKCSQGENQMKISAIQKTTQAVADAISEAVGL